VPHFSPPDDIFGCRRRYQVPHRNEPKRNDMNLNAKRSTRIAVIAAVSMIAFDLAVAQSQTSQSAKTGAGWGALAGLVFGGSLSDVVEGAVVGGVGGAVVGSSKGREQAAREEAQIARAREIRERERDDIEQETQRRAMAQAEYERRLDIERQQFATQAAVAQQTASAAPTVPDDAMLIRAFGQDTVTGWYALRDCKHDYALIAATAGENANAVSHQLAAVWLRAIIALDQKRANSANAALQSAVEIDPDVSTLADAQREAQELLTELRVDRRSAGVTCGT
jgi:hypothetical protein